MKTPIEEALNTLLIHLVANSTQENMTQEIAALEVIEAELARLYKITDDARYWLERGETEAALAVLRTQKN